MLPTCTVLDACTLLNLRAGWGHLSALLNSDTRWVVGERALQEAQFTYEFDAVGQRQKVQLTARCLVEEGGLEVLSLQPNELPVFIDFASQLDDGEAEALALAATRGFAVVSDDGLARKIASQHSPSIACLSTPEVLRLWAENHPERTAQLPQVLHRIQTLARFQPSVKRSEERVWWQSYVGAYVSP
jgi:hypothetical protein